jgi:hypothetical protein
MLTAHSSSCLSINFISSWVTKIRYSVPYVLELCHCNFKHCKNCTVSMQSRTVITTPNNKVKSTLNSSTFRDITQCSPLKVNGHFGETFRPHLQGRRKSKIKVRNRLHEYLFYAIPEDGRDIFLETSVDFHQTTRRYIPEDIILRNYRCENLKSYKVKVVPMLN